MEMNAGKTTFPVVSTIVGSICNHMWMEGFCAKMRTMIMPKLAMSRVALGMNTWRKESKQNWIEEEVEIPSSLELSPGGPSVVKILSSY